MKKTNMRRFGAIVAGLSLVLAACGGGDDAATDTTAAASGGELEGMKGTMPLVDLSDEFKTGLNDFWTAAGNAALEDFSYAAEAFDSVMLVALAAEVAGTDGSALANEIQNVSRDGEKCTTVEGCMELIKAGTDIDYDGASGPQDMNGNGEPVNASYGVLTFGADNRFKYEDASYVLADAPESDIVPNAEVTVERKGDGVLKIGSLLPETGSLAFLGPPEFAGVEYAISLINAAGGQADHLIIQRMGRGLRTAEDKESLKYFDFMFNINDYLNGCTNDGTDGIHVEQSGVYNYQFSVQFANTDAGVQTTYVWLRVNGVDVPGTGSKFDVPSKHAGSDGYLIAACNFYVELNAGDAVSMYAAVANTSVYMEAYTAQTSPFAMPSIPSVVATLSFVSSVPT